VCHELLVFHTHPHQWVGSHLYPRGLLCTAYPYPDVHTHGDTYSHANGNSYTDTNCNADRNCSCDCHGDLHSHFHPNYNHDSTTNSDIYAFSYSDDYTQANAYAQAACNAKGTTHPAAAPVAFVYEKETHYSIRTCSPSPRQRWVL
jgi:hypothetical protein